MPGERGLPDQSPVEPADLPLLCTFPQSAEEFCSCCFQPRLIHSLSSSWPPPCRALSYIELTNAQHFDAFLGNALLAGYDTRFVPLHVYFNQAMDRMWAHLTQNVPLPPSQVVRTIPRGGTPGAAPPITAANVPPISSTPAAGDLITFSGTTVTIPD